MCSRCMESKNVLASESLPASSRSHSYLAQHQGSIGIFFRGVSRGRFWGRFFWQAPRILEDGIRRYFWDLTDVLRVSGMLEQTYIRESSRAGFSR